MLTLSHISWRTPQGEQILKDISLEIPDNKLVAITGPNGGGKTTIAKIIAGLQQPDTGRILLDGKDITNLDITQRAQQGISYAFQQPVRFKGITVRDLIELAAGKPVSEQQICDMLGKVGLCAREYIDRQVDASLSGGEIKRIEIATVLARHTRLSIFDEPEAGIDLWSFAGLIEVFQDMGRQIDGSLVIISHQERILSIADEVIVIADGQVQQTGARQDVLPQLLMQENGCGQCHQCGKEVLE